MSQIYSDSTAIRKTGSSDTTLSTVSTISTGAVERYERLIEPHRASLIRHAYRLTRSPAEAEDLVQETMLRAYTRLETFRTSGSARGWLYAIQLNVFRNWYHRVDVMARPYQHLDDSHDVEDVRAARTEEPESYTLLAQQHKAALKALACLPRPYREVVALCDIDGKSYQEIADHVRVPVGTVRSRIHRGRGMLRSRLAAWHEAA